jgi:tetratricopeptide (TPR) repeat protein
LGIVFLVLSADNRWVLCRRQQQIGDGGKQSRQSSLLQHLCWQRQLGQATYNLGLLEKASHHLDTALLLIGEPVKPSDASHLLGKLKLKSPRAAPHLDPKLFKLSSQSSPTSSSATESPNSARKSSKKSSTLINLLVQNREHILILLTLGKVHYYACNKDLVTYCNLVALKKAEEYGISKELCEAYGNAIMTAGMHNKRDYAEALIGSGVALAQQFGKVDTDPYMNVLHAAGVYYTGIGMWKRAEEALTKCVKIAEEVGNPRRLEEAYGVISTSQYLQGKIRDSFATNELAVESARRRGDLQSQVLSLLAQARNQIALGQIDKALGSLLQIEAFAAKSDGYKLDVASEINYHALMAMVYVSKKVRCVGHYSSGITDLSIDIGLRVGYTDGRHSSSIDREDGTHGLLYFYWLHDGACCSHPRSL